MAGKVAGWAEGGRQIFLLGPRLLTMLGQTDISGVRFGDLKWPYDSFYVSFGKLFGGQLPGPANRIDGVYVSRSRNVLELTVTSRRLDANAKSSADWPFSRDVYYYLPLMVTDEELLISEAVDLALEEETRIRQTA